MVKNNKEVNRTLIVALVIIAIVLAFQFGRSSEKLNKKSGNMTITSSEQVANIDKVNKARGKHYKYYTNQEWGKLENYDFAFNSDYLGATRTAEMIKYIIIEKYNVLGK